MQNLDKTVVRVEQVTGREGTAALTMVLGDSAAAESMVAAASGNHVIFAASRHDRLVGAAWIEFRPGRVAALWPVAIEPSEGDETGEALVRAAVSAAREVGTRFVQSVLAHESRRDSSTWLKNCGFEFACDTWPMAAGNADFPSSQPASALQFETVPETQTARLAEVVKGTYLGSQDCPAFVIQRPIDEVLENYRGMAQYGRHWLLAQHTGTEVGCLLLGQQTQETKWELTYMGILPTYRGRGWGLALVRHAQWLARGAGVEQMHLAVDAANAPAISVYAAAGFLKLDRRSVFVWRFDDE